MIKNFMAVVRLRQTSQGHGQIALHLPREVAQDFRDRKFTHLSFGYESRKQQGQIVIEPVSSDNSYVRQSGFSKLRWNKRHQDGSLVVFSNIPIDSLQSYVLPAIGKSESYEVYCEKINERDRIAVNVGKMMRGSDTVSTPKTSVTKEHIVQSNEIAHAPITLTVPVDAQMEFINEVVNRALADRQPLTIAFK